MFRFIFRQEGRNLASSHLFFFLFLPFVCQIAHQSTCRCRHEIFSFHYANFNNQILKTYSLFIIYIFAFSVSPTTCGITCPFVKKSKRKSLFQIFTGNLCLFLLRRCTRRKNHNNRQVDAGSESLKVHLLVNKMCVKENLLNRKLKDRQQSLFLEKIFHFQVFWYEIDLNRKSFLKIFIIIWIFGYNSNLYFGNSKDGRRDIIFPQ